MKVSDLLKELAEPTIRTKEINDLFDLPFGGGDSGRVVEIMEELARIEQSNDGRFVARFEPGTLVEDIPLAPDTAFVDGRLVQNDQVKSGYLTGYGSVSLVTTADYCILSFKLESSDAA